MFSKGDLVVCIDPHGNLTPGKIYKITALKENKLTGGFLVKVENDHEAKRFYFDSRFHLATRIDLINKMFKSFLEKSFP